jgi:tRNA nucleotidyltransferase (CCA-adding enzyme)
LTHIKADFDALSSAYAALKLYNADFIFIDVPPENNVKDFIEQQKFNMPLKKISENELADIKKIDLLIITDCKYKNRLGKLQKLTSIANKIILFDHHPESGWDIEADEFYIDRVGSTTSIIVEKLLENHVILNGNETTFFLLGIYEDTGFLSFISTTARDLLICSKLMEQEAKINMVNQYIKRELTKEQIQVLNDLLNNLSFYDINGIHLSYSFASVDEYVGDISYLAHKIIDIENLDCLFILVRSSDRVFFVARSNTESVDVSKLAIYFGGGGHPYAASATIKDMTLQESLEKLKLIIEKTIKPVKFAKDIMTSPAKAISYDDTFEKALDLFTNYNFNTMPVVKGKTVVGIITRQDILKGIKHGLKMEPVNTIMQTEFDSATPDATFYEVENIMVAHNQKIIPVVDRDKIVGVITKVDLLRIFHDNVSNFQTFDKLISNRISNFKQKNVYILMKERLSKNIIKLLKEIGEQADNLNFNAYVVGGFVRDLLIDYKNSRFLSGHIIDNAISHSGFINTYVPSIKQNVVTQYFDIDIVVEGDATLLAKQFAQSKGVRTSIHYKFKTAIVIIENGLRVDFASSRTEYYDFPASAPNIEYSSIKSDLFRRDFTINAMAIKINLSDFGLLLDFYGGQKDIIDKKIRVLHNLSFIDDPTRGIRAIRFAIRYNFNIGPHTSKLLKHAVSLKLFERVKGSRLLYELKHIFLEVKYLDGLKLMKKYNIIEFFNEKIVLDENKFNTFKMLDRIFEWFTFQFRDEVNIFISRFCVFIDELKYDDLKVLTEKLQFPHSIKKDFISNFFRSKDFAAKLKKSENIKPSFVYQIFKEMRTEFIFYVGALLGGEFEEHIKNYFTNYRFVKLHIKGDDLIKRGYKPSKYFGQILNTLLLYKIDGVVHTKDDELRVAKELFKEYTLLEDIK